MAIGKTIALSRWACVTNLSCIIREMQIKNHNEASSHTSQNGCHQKVYKQCWRRYREKGPLLHCWWECKLIQPLWRTVCRFLKKLEIELPYDAAILLLGIHMEETRDRCTRVHCSTVYNSQDMEATWMSIGRWMDKEVVHIHNGILIRYKNITHAFESVLMRWIKLEPIIQSEVFQKEKHQYSILMHIYGI